VAIMRGECGQGRPCVYTATCAQVPPLSNGRQVASATPACFRASRPRRRTRRRAKPQLAATGVPTAGQQAFGDDLLRRHRFVAIPSAVSTHSWNLIFDPLKAAGFYSLEFQEPFALDTRLHPPA